MASTVSASLLDHYQAAIAAGEIREDAYQAVIVDALSTIYVELVEAESTVPATKPEGSIWLWLRAFFWPGVQADQPAVIKGLYVWGGVGRGKTFIVDFFFNTLPIKRKRRDHFHTFMKSVHEQLQELKQVEDPLKHLAKQIARQTRVLVLDEMHVNDIGDAMIMGRLLEHLFANGVTLITTSNFQPSGLYPNGLQRSRFLPAIALLEQHTTVLKAEGTIDYRLRVLEKSDVYLVGKPEDTDATLESFFAALVGEEAVGEADTIEVGGREVPVRNAVKSVVWVDFSVLCEGARSTSDYIELAEHYDTVIVSDVPVLTKDDDDAARRFVNLIDALYDHRVNVVASAAVAPELLYTGKRLEFEFARTASRLTEMQSRDYIYSESRSGQSQHTSKVAI